MKIRLKLFIWQGYTPNEIETRKNWDRRRFVRIDRSFFEDSYWPSQKLAMIYMPCSNSSFCRVSDLRRRACHTDMILTGGTSMSKDTAHGPPCHFFLPHQPSALSMTRACSKQKQAEPSLRNAFSLFHFTLCHSLPVHYLKQCPPPFADLARACDLSWTTQTAPPVCGDWCLLCINRE